MKRRFFSMILAMVMLLGMLPAPAFAAGAARLDMPQIDGSTITVLHSSPDAGEKESAEKAFDGNTSTNWAGQVHCGNFPNAPEHPWLVFRLPYPTRLHQVHLVNDDRGKTESFKLQVLKDESGYSSGDTAYLESDANWRDLAALPNAGSNRDELDLWLEANSEYHSIYRIVVLEHGDSNLSWPHARFREVYLYGDLQEPGFSGISFAPNGADGPNHMAGVRVADGSSYEIPQNDRYTKTGYRFLHWTGSDSVTYNPGDHYTVVGDLTLTAVWEVIPVHTVTFDRGGATGGADMPPEEVLEGADFLTPECTFTWPDHRFAGWWNVEADEAYKVSAMKLYADLTLRATWEEIQYTNITFDKGGADGSETQEPVRQETATTYTIPACPYTNTNKRFLYWQDQNGKTYNPNDEITLGEDLTLTAVWREIVYHTVFFNPGVPSIDMPEVQQELDASYEIPQISGTWEKHRFLHWIDSEGNAYTPGQTVIIKGDLGLTAVWTDEYTVTFTADEGFGVTPEAVKVADGESVTLGKMMMHTAEDGSQFDFMGWQKDGVGKIYQYQETVVPTGDTTFKAVFLRYCNAAYSLPGVNFPVGRPHPGETYTLETASEMIYWNRAPEGKTLDYWSVTWDGQAEPLKVLSGGELTIPDANALTITPVWRDAVEVTVTIDPGVDIFGNSAGESYTQAIKEGTRFSAPETAPATPEGHQLLGWSVDGGKTFLTDSHYITGPETVTAYWGETDWNPNTVDTKILAFNCDYYKNATTEILSTMVDGVLGTGTDYRGLYNSPLWFVFQTAYPVIGHTITARSGRADAQSGYSDIVKNYQIQYLTNEAEYLADPTPEYLADDSNWTTFCRVYDNKDVSHTGSVHNPDHMSRSIYRFYEPANSNRDNIFYLNEVQVNGCVDWPTPPVKVSFAPGMAGDAVPTGTTEPILRASGMDFVMPDHNYNVTPGYLFAGWSDGAGNLYQAGETVSLSASTELTATWTPVTENLSPSATVIWDTSFGCDYHKRPAQAMDGIPDKNLLWQQYRGNEISSKPASFVFMMPQPVRFSAMRAYMEKAVNEGAWSSNLRDYRLQALAAPLPDDSSLWEKILSDPVSWKSIAVQANNQYPLRDTDFTMDGYGQVFRFDAIWLDNPDGWYNRVLAELMLYGTVQPADTQVSFASGIVPPGPDELPELLLLGADGVPVQAGAGVGTTMAPVQVAAGSYLTLPEPTFLPPFNKSFAGWDIGGGVIRQAGDFVRISAPVTLTATWDAEPRNLALHARVLSTSGEYTPPPANLEGKHHAVKLFDGIIRPDYYNDRYEWWSCGGSANWVAFETIDPVILNEVVINHLDEGTSGSNTREFVLQYLKDEAGRPLIMDQAFLNNDANWVSIDETYVSNNQAGETRTPVTQLQGSHRVFRLKVLSSGISSETTQIRELKLIGTKGWKQPVQVTYLPGEGGSGSPISAAHEAGSRISLPDGSAFTAPEGMVLKGWQRSDDGQIYLAGQGVALAAGQDLTFTAVWRLPPENIARTAELYFWQHYNYKPEQYFDGDYTTEANGGSGDCWVVLRFDKPVSPKMLRIYHGDIYGIPNYAFKVRILTEEDEKKVAAEYLAGKNDLLWYNRAQWEDVAYVVGNQDYVTSTPLSFPRETQYISILFQNSSTIGKHENPAFEIELYNEFTEPIWTVNYQAGTGGSGEMAPSKVVHNHSYALPDPQAGGLVPPEGETYYKWDGVGAAGSYVTVRDDMNLTAVSGINHARTGIGTDEELKILYSSQTSFTGPVANLFDGDPSTRYIPPQGGMTTVVVDLGKSIQLEALKIFDGESRYAAHGDQPHVYSVRVLDTVSESRFLRMNEEEQLKIINGKYDYWTEAAKTFSLRREGPRNRFASPDLAKFPTGHQIYMLDLYIYGGGYEGLEPEQESIGEIEFYGKLTPEDAPDKAMAVPYTDLDGTEQTAPNGYILDTDSTSIDYAWAYVPAGAKLRFDELAKVKGSVNLVLEDGGSVLFDRGLQIDKGSTLTIWQHGTGTGTLTANAYRYNSYPKFGVHAPIGSGFAERSNPESLPFGKLVVNGGTILADGTTFPGYAFCGIGGIMDADSEIVVNGGTVTAKGGSIKGNGYDDYYGSPGIGSLSYDAFGTVTINGGEVNAYGGWDAAGIGSSSNYHSVPPKVVITGGVVNAYAGDPDKSPNKPAAIGGAGGDDGNSITILGGTINLHNGHMGGCDYSTINYENGELIYASAPRARDIEFSGQPQELLELSAAPAYNEHYIYSLEEQGTYTSDIPKKDAVGVYPVYYKTVTPNGKEFPASAPLMCEVKKTGIVPTVVSVADKVYNGKTDGVNYTLDFTYNNPEKSGEPALEPGTDYTVSAAYTSRNVSFDPEEKNVSLTLTLTEEAAKGYDFVNGDVRGSTVTILVHGAVTPAELTVTANAHIISYGDDPANNGVSYSGFQEGDNQGIVDNTKLEYTYTYVKGSPVGSSYLITPKGVTAPNYDVKFAPGFLTVTPRAITIRAKDQSVALNGDISQLPADVTVTSGQLLESDAITAIVLTADTANATPSGVITPSDAEIKTGGAAGLDITASYAITYEPGVLTVSKAASQVTAPPAVLDREYDGINSALVSAGTAEGGVLVYSTAETDAYAEDIPTARNADTYSVWYKVKGDANHEDTEPQELTVTITPLTLTAADLEYTGDPITKAYDSTTDVPLPENGSFRVKASSLMEDDVLPITGSCSYNFADVATGTQVSFVPDAITTGNYRLAADQILSVPASITKAPFGSRTGSSAARYGTEGTVALSGMLCDGAVIGKVTTTDANQILSGTPSVSGTTLSYTLADDNTKDGKTAEVAIEVSAPNYADYTITVTVTLNGKDAAEIVMDNGEVTYGEAYVPSAAVTGVPDAVLTYSYQDAEGMPLGAEAPTAAGSYTVTAVFENDTLFGTVSVPLTIRKAPLTVTANAAEITYGDAPGGNGVVYGTFRYEENESVLKGELRYNINYRQFDPVDGSWTITPAGLSADNYELQFLPGVLTVLPRALTVTANDGQSIVYGGTVSQTPDDVSVTAGELVNGDAITAVTLEPNIRNVPGDYLNLTGVTIRSHGSDVTGNYDMTLVRGTMTITRAASSVTAPTPVAKLTYTGGALELVTPGTATGGTLVYSDAEAGEYTAAVPTGTDAGDYEIWYKVQGDSNHSDTVPASVTAHIAQAQPVVTAPAAARVPYTGAAQPLVTGGSTTGGTLVYSTARDGAYTAQIPTGTAVKSYEVWYKVEGDGNYKATAPQVLYPQIVAATPVVTPPAPALELTYTGSPIPLITAGSTTGGTLMYSTTSASAGWSAELPTATAAGPYTVWYKVVGDGNYESTAAGSITVTITGAASSVTAPPVPVSGLTYNTRALTLITGGSAEGGTLVYSTTSASAGWSAELPTATDAGEYTVYYKVQGDANHADSEPASVTVTIGQGESAILQNPQPLNRMYNGEVKDLVLPGKVSGGTMAYSVTRDGADWNGEPWSDTIPTAADVGKYTIWFKVDGGRNYKGTEMERWPVNVTISKADPVYVPAQANDITFDGTAHALITPASTEDGTITYTCYATRYFNKPEVPTATSAGDYEVIVNIKGDDNHNTVSQTVPVTVKPWVLTSDDLVPAFTAENPCRWTYFNGVLYDSDMGLQIRKTETYQEDRTLYGRAEFDHPNATGPDAATKLIWTPEAVTAGNFRLDPSQIVEMPAEILKREYVSGNKDTLNLDHELGSTVTEALTFCDGAQISGFRVYYNDSEIFEGTPRFDTGTRTLTYKLTSDEAKDGHWAGLEMHVTSQNYQDYDQYVRVSGHRSGAITYADVTFRIAGGTWDGEDAADKVVRVKLVNGKGTLTADQIPDVRQAKPTLGEYEKPGNWNSWVNTDRDAVTGDVTYTYTFAKHNHDFHSWKWEHDETSHWHPCDCGARGDEAPHSFEWIVDKEASVTEAGSKHQKCTVCGYETEPVEIPILPVPVDITFRIVGGTWADGTAADKVVTVNTVLGVGTLNAADVPTGMHVAPYYEGDGSWDVTPNTEADAVTGAVTYTYSFTKSPTVITNVDVTFKVVNGTWADHTTEDIVVSVELADGKGTLPEGKVPTGMLVGEGFVGGSWDATPDTASNAVTGAVTYTFSFVRPTVDVTFRVVNGTWADRTTADKIVPVELIDGRGTLTSDRVPVGMMPAKDCRGGSWDVTPNTDAEAVTEAVTYTYTFDQLLVIDELAVSGGEVKEGQTADLQHTASGGHIRTSVTLWSIQSTGETADVFRALVTYRAEVTLTPANGYYLTAESVTGWEPGRDNGDGSFTWSKDYVAASEGRPTAALMGVSETGNVTVQLADVQKDQKCLAAAYDENGCVLGLCIYTVGDHNGNDRITIHLGVSTEKTDKVKVFLVDSLFRPLCESRELALHELPLPLL